MPDVVRPNSAEGVDVVTLNSWRASIEGEVSSNDEPFSLRVMLAPSSNTSAPYAWPPLKREKNTPLPVLPLVPVPGPVVPGNRKTNVSGERSPPTPDASDSGRSSTCLLDTVPPTSELSVSRRKPLASTVTFSVCEPTLSFTFNAEMLLIVTCTPVSTSDAKPAAVVVTV